MALTTEQLQALKAFIAGDSNLNQQPNNDDGHFAIAAAMNQIANPAHVVWRSNVSINEIMSNGFDWTRVDNLSVGKSRIWEYMTQLGSLDPSKANVRAGIDATWVGTAADLAVRAAVYTHCKRNATVAEKLFASGTGSTAVPATMAFEGQLQFSDVSAARNLP